MDLRTASRKVLGALVLALALATAPSLVTGVASANAATTVKTGSTAKKAKRATTSAQLRHRRYRAPVARLPVSPPPRPARHLIIIPGGGFTSHDPKLWPTVAPIAKAAGFVPHLLEYRLFDLGGAVADAYELASELASRFGRGNIFAYGSSAGGTLATLLASRGLVAAAVSSSGLYDFRYWPWATVDRGPDYLDSIGADWDSRRAHSPIGQRLRCPLLALHGSWDPVVFAFQAQDYAATHPRAALRIYPAGHGLYRSRPGTIRGSLRWLNRIGNKQARLSRGPMPRGARAAEAARRIRCG